MNLASDVTDVNMESRPLSDDNYQISGWDKLKGFLSSIALHCRISSHDLVGLSLQFWLPNEQVMSGVSDRDGKRSWFGSEVHAKCRALSNTLTRQMSMVGGRWERQLAMLAMWLPKIDGEVFNWLQLANFWQFFGGAAIPTKSHITDIKSAVTCQFDDDFCDGYLVWWYCNV